MRRIVIKILLLVLLLNLLKTEGTNSYFTSEAKVEGMNFSMACWNSPSFPFWPAPADGFSVGAIWDLNPVFSWNTVTGSCPGVTAISYQFEIYRDAGMTDLVYRSGWLTEPQISQSGLKDGTYYWHVKTKDNFDNESDFGPLWKLTIDRVAPTVSLSISGSWSKLVEEKIVNGDFKDDLSGWTTTGDVSLTTIDGQKVVKIGSDNSDPEYLGNFVWENRLMQSFPAGAKTLALDYNFKSDDYGDDPGFLIRLNGREVLGLDSSVAGSSWQTFKYDLSSFRGPNIDLALYAGNALDRTYQSWAYIKKVSTYYVAVPAHAVYTISSSEEASCRYQVDDGVWQNGNSFSIATGGTHHVNYSCTDHSGNSSAINELVVITDVTAPAKITDLTAEPAYPNMATLHWTAPANDGNDWSSGPAAQYDIRYSTSPITNESSFDAANRMVQPKQPLDPGSTESIHVDGLTPDTDYYFAVRAADEAPNWSEIAYTTIPVRTPLADPPTEINEGDIVINELMWMGTATGSADEYIELRNTTDRAIDMSALKLMAWNQNDNMFKDMPISLSGQTIAAKGYFLISHYNSGDSKSDLNSSVHVNLVAPGISLSNNNLEIKLVETADENNLIDQAWNGTTPGEGLHDGNKHYAMERVATVGDGSKPLSWYTDTDPATTALYFKGTADDRGTPGAPNRAEQELKSEIIPATESAEIAATEAAMPTLDLVMADDQKTVSFTLKNISSFDKFNYQLNYDTDTVSDGVVGNNVNLTGEDPFTKDGIKLATCSTEGIVCTYYTNPHNFKLQVWLFRPDNSSVLLTKELP
ncbi:lamin tail domain-containing protein [Patescibacteria group bacterium]|nr:lamin tail domain-containing protein [Patescibacteria group bacterium]